MRTAHGARRASASSATAGSDGRVLVAWDHESIDQLSVIDLMGHGWRCEFVPAAGAKQEHVKVLAPRVSAASTAFITFKDFAYEGDVSLSSIHGFFDTDQIQYIYQVAVGQGEWTDAYAGARWSFPDGHLVGVANPGIGDLLIASNMNALTGHDPKRLIVESRVSFRGSLMGKGNGCIQNYGVIPASQPAQGMRTMGMGFKLAVPAGQHVEIYDMVMSAGSRS